MDLNIYGTWRWVTFEKEVFPIVGVKVRNTKMDLNIYGTWCRVLCEKLMMKF